MDAFWVDTLVTVGSGTVGAAVMAVVPQLRNAHGHRSEAGDCPEAPAAPPAPVTSVTAVARPCPKQQLRCERSVQRAAAAVETVSSFADRQALRAVVRRMDAELPNVGALVELSRSLDVGAGEGDTVERVHWQLDDAGARFGMLADQLMEVVEQHVAEPDRERLRTEVTVLRGQFPLLRPMSSILPRPRHGQLAEVTIG